MATVDRHRATIDDLAQHEGKAELIAGRIVPLMPTGRRPNRIAFRIARSLDDHAQRLGIGEAYTDNMGFVVPELASGRESFSPDASYFRGPFVDDPMRFLAGPPTLAVEVRGEGDRGPAADRAMAAKRADDFEAGTLIVLDVDPEAEIIHAHRPDGTMISYAREVASAEPALPGWRIAVDDVFDA